MQARLTLAAIILTYITLAILYAVRTPAWQAPDEPAHYNYVATLARGEWPVMRAGDWDSAALESYKAVRWVGVTDEQIAAIRYENHQPPLYYLLAVPVYALSDGDLTALRLYSALWGVVIVLCAYGVGALLFPARREIGLASAAFVAFQPMHLHILASVNNDALGWAVVAVGLWLGVAHLKRVPVLGQPVTPVMLGLIAGIGLITKATTYFMAGLLGGVVVVGWWLDGGRDTRALIAACARYLLVALALGALWWGRNIIVYGWPDFLGLAVHDVIVADQPRTSERIDALGWGGYLTELGRTTFNSFWGQFGWMGLPLQASWYAVIAVCVTLLLGGGLLAGWGAWGQSSRRQRWAWALLALTIVAAIGAYLYYNSEFQQYQGRYMFTLLIPLGVWLACGADFWRRRFTAGRWPVLTTALIALPLLTFALYLIWRVIPGGL